MKTLVMVNTLTSVDARAYGSHCQEWFRIGKQYSGEDEVFIFHAPHRLSIDRARNLAVQEALMWECEYIYFIDDDMVLYPGTYKMLRDADKDVVMAHSVIRGYPFHNMHFVDQSDPHFKGDKEYADSLEYFDDHKDYIDEKGLVRVDAIGCATVLFKTKIFRDIQPPWFVTLSNMTEDIYFCLKAQRYYGRKKLGIYVHTGCPTAHIMDPEMVYPAVVEKMKKRVEEDEPVITQQLKDGEKKSGDRGQEYAETIMSTLDKVEVEEEFVYANTEPWVR